MLAKSSGKWSVTSCQKFAGVGGSRLTISCGGTSVPARALVKSVMEARAPSPVLAPTSYCPTTPYTRSG
jgi:hypothetical protein